MGKCGSCNNFPNSCFFLTKVATWIDSKVENILLNCLPNINFGCYSTLTLPLAYNERMRILQYTLKTTWTLFPLPAEVHIIPRKCSLDLAHLSQGVLKSPRGHAPPLHFIKALISQKPFRSPSLNHTYSCSLC